MKKFLTVLCTLAVLSLPCFAQATLDLLGSNDSAVVTTTPGSTFTLNIDYTSTALTSPLAAFDITLSGSPSSASALPAGLTFDGFSNLVSGFSGAVSGLDSDTYSAAANASADDISSTTPTTLLTATFTAVTGGSFAIYFAPNGSTTTDDQGLYANNASAITYVATGATVAVAPEPSVDCLLGLGFVSLLGIGLYRRTSAA